MQQNPEEKTERIPVAEYFSYPIGDGGPITSRRDKKDEWYDAQNFGRNNHLGEDWNGNGGGNTDCGEPVYSIGDGVISYADDAGPGWGSVVIITHRLPDGKKVQSLYGHLKSIDKKTGAVKRRDKIGEVGNADGRYLCHLHLEIREEDCPQWDEVYLGYSTERAGWLDPSDFIDSRLFKYGV
ncbi:MAG: M23 family metallopeptidase [Pyrinomonadaceae bacterium]